MLFVMTHLIVEFVSCKISTYEYWKYVNKISEITLRHLLYAIDTLKYRKIQIYEWNQVPGESGRSPSTMKTRRKNVSTVNRKTLNYSYRQNDCYCSMNCTITICCIYAQRKHLKDKLINITFGHLSCLESRLWTSHSNSSENIYDDSKNRTIWLINFIDQFSFAKICINTIKTCRTTWPQRWFS